MNTWRARQDLEALRNSIFIVPINQLVKVKYRLNAMRATLLREASRERNQRAKNELLMLARECQSTSNRIKIPPNRLF